MHVSGMSFLNERFLRFVLIVWSLYIRVSITSIVFLMGSLMNNDLVSKNTHTHTHTQRYTYTYIYIYTYINSQTNWMEYLE